jgi:hypothetical protein
MTTVHGNCLSDDEKRQLYRDGFVILHNALSREQTARAKAHISTDPTRIVWGNDAVINGLYNDSILVEVLDEAMGPHTRPINAQVAVVMPHAADAVVRGKVDPNNIQRMQGHVDGGWAGLCPVRPADIIAAGQSLHTWGCDGDPKSLGPAGGAPLWQDRQRTLAIGSYTALAAVCLNDQRQPGKGQFAVHRGGHEAAQEVFRLQRQQGGTIGGGGPLWPRLVQIGDKAFAGIMPKAMVERYPDLPFEMAGWHWPNLTPALMEEGDAIIALHSLPHTATPNLSDDPRMNVLFRIRRLRPENPYEGDVRIQWGVSDHPDRMLSGDFLDYPDDYNPYQTSIDKLCDHWSEWDGLQHLVAGAEDAA